jgi:RNA polymerase sigma factor (sigma-70 family)
MSAEADLWSSEAWSSAADVHLLAQAREGSAEAYGELWRRHLSAAYAVATRHRGRAAPEDIVAEASARVFDLIRRGKGPEEHFRAYFLSTVRTVATDHARRDLRIVPAEADQLEVLAEPVHEVHDTDGIDADLVREAFAELPERDQRVLWHTTVEGEAPRTIAPRLGLTANAVSARAVRAREALRARYLDAHAQRSAGTADNDECRWAIEHLGAHVRGQLPKRKAERVHRHLQSCSRTAALATELEQIRSGFPALVVPLVLLAGISTPGFVSAGALGALAGVTGGLGSSSSVTPPSSGNLTEVIARLANLAAGSVIAVAVAGAGPAVPAAPVVAAPALSVPTATAPTVPPVLPSAAPSAALPAEAPSSAAPLPSSPPRLPPETSRAPVQPPRVERSPLPATTAVVTGPTRPRPVVPAPPVTGPAPTAPAPTITAPPTPPPTAPSPTAPPTETLPNLVIEGRFTTVGPPTSTVRIEITQPQGVAVTVVVTTGSRQATLAQHSNRHRCQVDPRGTTLTCTVKGGAAPLVVLQSGVNVPTPIIVTATTADGKSGTLTILTR